MKFLLSLLLLTTGFTACIAQAEQTSTYTGIVMGSGRPVAGATVSIKANHISQLTDSEGRFVFKDVLIGKIKLEISAVGFTPVVRQVLIGAEEITDTIEMQPAVAVLDDVVVSGTMKAISKMESPIPVEVYTPAHFKKNPSPSIFESLQMVNGVQPQLNCNVCNTGDIHINGMEGPYTMILIDGMPIVSSLATVYGLSGIPNSLIKRVEIVKGPASTLYGSEAVGGLINIITKDPLQTEKLKVDASITSVGEKNIDITTGIRGSKASVVTALNYFSFNNRRDVNHDNFTDITLQNRFSIFNKWSFNRKSNLKASLALRYVFEDRWGGELQWNKSLRGSDAVYGEAILTNRFELIGNYQLAANLSADVSYNYHLQDSYYGTTKYYAQQHVAFGQLRWNKTLHHHDLLAGLPLRYTYYDDNSPATAKNGINDPSTTMLPGVFVQDEWKLSEKLVTLIGLRYDHNNVHGSIVTPRLSFKYSATANKVLRVSGGNGYRVVNLFTEDHAALTGARQVVIAEELRPEQSWNVNFNYAQNIQTKSGHINVDASLFYTYFTNKIIGDFISDPVKIIYDNLKGHAISKGATLNLDVVINRRLKMDGGITLMKVYEASKDSTGSRYTIPQMFAPAFSGTFTASYSVPRYALTFDLTGRVNGPMYLPVVPNDFRPEKSPLYGLLNLQATKMFSKKWEIYGGVKNLLNFMPVNPILHPDDPFNKPGGKYFDGNNLPRPDTNPNGYTFDPSYNYAPMQPAKGYVGIRYSI